MATPTYNLKHYFPMTIAISGAGAGPSGQLVYGSKNWGAAKYGPTVASIYTDEAAATIPLYTDEIY